MNTNRVLVLGFCLAVVQLCSGAESPPDPLRVAGPENHGLRLQFRITTKRDGGEDLHSVQLQVTNVSPRMVTLLARWPYQHLTGDYAEFLKSRIEFLTFPEVLPGGEQTAGASRLTAQPKYELRPGASLATGWQVRGPWLKPKNVFDAVNTGPHFPSDGLYWIRARIVLETEGGERILLTSNPEPLLIGGSTHAPKYATARIVATNSDAGTAVIDLGTDYGLAKGDLFSIHHGFDAHWLLTLTTLQAATAEGSVRLIHHSGAADVPRFPWPSAVATLVPQDSRTELIGSAPSGRPETKLNQPR